MGAVVDNRFEVLALAGEGGMGRVYRAIDRQGRGIVAVKVMREIFDDGGGRQRFLREIDVLTRLAHPAIVPYVAHGTTSGWPYLAMQWVDGEELRERLKRGPLDVQSTIAVATRIADALAHAHAHGIMHRDVKPSNVLLPHGAFHEAMLIDFGLARSGDDHQLTHAGSIIGTPNYMAPEQIRNTNVSPAVDVFALGCVIYRCLVGAPPFGAHDATAVLGRVIFDEPASLPSETVPTALAVLVDAMLSKTPSDRPHMDRVFDVVSALASGRQVDVSHVGLRRDKIGEDEQRIVSVIVAGESSITDADATLQHAPHTVDVAAVNAIVVRFGGDMRVLPHGVVVALFKARSAATDLATRVAECALELEHLALPLALATGRADAGSAVLVGEAIDRALALAPAHGDAIRVDAVTAGLLDARFILETDSRGTLLRGHRTPGALRVLLGKPTACVGRESEIAILDALVTQSANDSVARAVVVTGPAGAGKSRIRHELLLQMSARGGDAQVCMARGDSVSGGVPFGMAAQIIMQTTGIQEGDPRRESEQKLLAHTKNRRIAMFLGEIVQVRFRGEDDVTLQTARRDPMLMGEQMQRAFVDFLDLECRKRPVVVIAEDIQWGDRPSMDALDAALRACIDLPLVVLALARPETSAVFPNLWSERGVQHLALAPLSRRAAERLVRDCLSAPSHVVDLIVQRAAGNAFFLEELIRAASEGRTEMPETIVAMIDSRLGALEDASRRILRAASVFGETFWKGSVRVLVGDDAEDLGPKLDDLARREFLTRREGSRVAGEVEYTFRHALVRDGAYAMLTKADRVLGHRLAAEWLEKVGEGAAHVIAEHFAKSGDGRAVGAYLRAAEQAFESNDLATAIDCAERGIDLGAVGETRGALHAVRASALLWRGDLAEFERATAALVSEGTDVWWNAVERLVNAAGKLTDVDVVLATVERIDQAASAQTVSRHVALAIAAAVTTLVHLGRYDSAKRLLRFAEGDAVAREGIPAAAFAQARARLDLALGDIGAFRTQMAFARQVYENAGEMKQSCQCTLSSGYGALLIGQYAEAERELKRALELASQLDVPRVVLSAKHNLGLVFLRLGRIEESVAIESEALHLAREQKNLRMEGACLYYLSLVLHALGDFDAAEARALESVQACEHIPPSRGEALAALARARIAKGNVSQATADAKEALDIAEAVGGIDEGEPFIRLVYAEALHASGALSEAREAISEARTHLEARAQKITDPGARATFLSVPENARTLELAQRW